MRRLGPTSSSRVGRLCRRQSRRQVGTEDPADVFDVTAPRIRNHRYRPDDRVHRQILPDPDALRDVGSARSWMAKASRSGCSGRWRSSAAGQPIDAGPPRQRALLTLLLTAPNRVVPADRIAELLWQGEPSDQVSVSIQAYVSRLRRALEPERSPRSPSAVLVTRAPGYSVAVDLDTFDVSRFEADLERAQALLATDPAAALAGRRGG